MNLYKFKQYTDANSSCDSEWAGAMLAKVPTFEHNQMVAAILGPSFAGDKPWIGKSLTKSSNK